MKIEKGKINAILTKGPFLTFGRLECLSCHESYFAYTDGRQRVVVPSFVEEMDVFPAECPICDQGEFARLITFIQHDTNWEKKYEYSNN